MIPLIRTNLTIDRKQRKQIMPNWKWEIGKEKPFTLDKFYEKPSKSQCKRDMVALQKLGEQLVEQSVERIRNALIPDDLRNAILECQRIKNHEGHRRQLQYIGKLMRGLQENEIETIKQQLDNWKGLSKTDIALLHAVENLRMQLLKNPNTLTGFLERFPQANSQQLRTLIRNAKKEQTENRPPKAFRELYRQIKVLLKEQQSFLPPATETTEIGAK